MIWLSATLLSFLSSYLSKFEEKMGFLSFFLFGISMGIPNYLTNGDANVYERNYGMQSNEFEVGYNYISQLFGQKYDYSTFRLITSILFCLALCFGVSLITKKVSTFAFLYGICAFPFDTLQVRSSMATTFIIFGIFFLNKYEKKGIFLSVITIYIGSLFHSSALIFMIIPIGYLFINMILKNEKIFFSGLIASVILLVSIGSTRIGNVISHLLLRYSTREDASANVLNVYGSGSSFVALIMVLIFTIFLAMFLFNEENITNFPIYKITILAFTVWILGFVLFTLSVDYIRILRITLLIVFIYSSYLLSRKTRKIRFLNFNLLFALLLFLIQMRIYGLSMNTIFSNLSLL